MEKKNLKNHPEEISESMKIKRWRKEQWLAENATPSIVRGLQEPPQVSLSDFLPNVWMSGDVTVLHAEDNTGKSILAMQLADEVGRKGHKVVYCDFEMKARTFAERYYDGHTGAHTELHFIRLTRNLRGLGTASITADGLLTDIADAMHYYYADVLVVDTINYICACFGGYKASDIISKLVSLARGNNWSLLLVARNSLPEGQLLTDICDAAFSIGKVCGNKEVYIKQTRCRDVRRYTLNENNVKVCRIVKDGPMLRFEHVRYDSEKRLITRLEVR